MRILPLVLAALPMAATAEPLQIVTDFPPVQSLVMQVAGERADVDVLLDPNADPHSFQLRPSQAQTLANSDYLFWIGEELTPWLERATQGVASDLPNLAFFDVEDHHEDKVDPHIWLDTHLATEMLDLIAGELSAIDPDGAAYYAQNAQEAAAEIDRLTTDVADILKDVTEVPFAVTHEGYNYFIDQFGLTQIGSLKDVNDAPANAGNVSDLAQQAENGRIVCAFGEVGESSKLLDLLVEQGARQGADLDPAGMTLKQGAGLYRALITTLATSLADCLEG